MVNSQEVREEFQPSRDPETNIRNSHLKMDGTGRLAFFRNWGVGLPIFRGFCC